MRKYLRGQLGERERRQVDDWYDSFGYSTDVEPLQNEEKADRIYRELAGHLNRHAQPRRSMRRWFPLAAATLVAVLAGYGVWSLQRYPAASGELSVALDNYDTVQTAVKQMKHVRLPDGTEVWLNAATQLRYRAAAFAQQREVILDHGEAYFDVVHDPSRPFTVQAGSLNTTVLGTSFNVKNYPGLDYESVHVKTGKVVVAANAGTLRDTVAAGHGIKYPKAGGAFLPDDQFAAYAGSWTEGRMLLDNATFDELALVLEHRFGVHFHTELPAAGGFRYTITIIQDTPLEETMRLICDIHQTNYRRKGNEITMY